MPLIVVTLICDSIRQPMADPSPQAIEQPVSAIGMSKIECLVRLAPLSALKLKLALLPSGCASRIPSEPVSLHSEEGEFELRASLQPWALAFRTSL